MENWVGVKSCLPQYFPPLSFPLFLYWFRVSEKGGQKSNGLAFELGNTFFFFFGQGGLVSVHFFSGIYTS